MVAIVNGLGLGLYNSSLKPLNGSSLGQGRPDERIFVNAHTGNLVLQFQDEYMSGTGADLRHLRTYNSLGTLNDGDADQWRWQGERRATLTGTLNSSGSTVALVGGDGYETIYTWNGSVYLATVGDGAHDTISWDSGTSEWVRTEGGTGVTERFDGTSGWIKTLRDASGNGFDYTFASDKLTKIVDINSGQTFEMVYGGNGKLSRLDTRTTVTGSLTSQVYYNYDGSDRLASVVTDLTPSDNSISDSNVFTTTYTYDSSSMRIASISQSDGTQASFTYVLVGSDYRVATVTDAGGVSTFTYDTTNRRTDIEVTNGITDTWSYYHDTSGRLTRVESTAVSGVRQAADYAYDSDGNLASVTDGRGNVINYTYDANGNRTQEKDNLGNTIDRSYDSGDRLVTETRYAVPHATTPSAPETERYVYDTSGRLRYTVSAEGRVSENRYSSQGLLTASVQYAGGVYDVSSLATTATLSLSQLDTWVSTQDNTKTQLTEFSYDYRGNVSQKREFAAVNSSGVGTTDDTDIITHYTYSEHGQLLQTLVSANSGTPSMGSSVYDGMGRLTSTVDGKGTTTTSYGTNTITVSNSASGLSVVTALDNYGRVLSVASNGDSLSRTTQFVYDGGWLRMTQTPTGERSFIFYDAAGRVSFRVDALGFAVQYNYDADGRLTEEVSYKNAVSTSGWYDGTSVTKHSLTIGTTGTDIITHTDDRSTTYTYDNAGRLTQTSRPVVAAIVNTYDGASRLTQTSQGGAITRYFYDKDGVLIGTLDGERYFSEHIYDAAGRLTQTVRYATQASTTLQSSGTFAMIQSAVSGTTLQSFYYYDAQGRQIGRVNEQGFLLETVYDAEHLYREEKQYLTAVTATSSSTLAGLKAGAGTAETTRYEFDAFGRLIAKTAAEGTITNYLYDSAGRLARMVNAAGTADERISHTRYNAFGDVIGTVTVAGAEVENYAWQLDGNGDLEQTTGLSLAPGSALFNDETPTEVKATIYSSNDTLYDTVYTQVGSTVTSTINTRPPVQPHGYTASATNDVITPATQTVAITVDSTQQYAPLTTSSNVQNFGYTYSPSTRLISGNGSGYSLGTNSADHNDNSPTSVLASIRNLDGQILQAVTFRPGHTTVAYVIPGGYGSPEITYYQWNPATNWNGHVNLGSLAPGEYYAVITTEDEATPGGAQSTPGTDGDSLWTRTNTEYFTIGGGSFPDHIDTRISWPVSAVPSDAANVSFRYKVDSGAWTSPATFSAATQYFDIDHAAGDYEYEIVFLDADNNILKTGTGVFTVKDAADSTVSANFTYNDYSASETSGAAFTAFPITSTEASTIAYIEAKVFQSGTSTQVGTTAVTYPDAHEDYFSVSGEYYVNLRTGSAIPDGQYDVQVIKYYKNGTSATVNTTLEVGIQSGSTTQYTWDSANNWTGEVNLKIGSGSLPADTYRVEISVRDDASSISASPGTDGDGTWQRINTVYTTVGTAPALSTLNAAIDTYGVRYEYDGAGRRVSELGPDGQKTLLYYDKNNRLVYTVNALGEVTATTYNSFGEVASTTAYTGVISVTGLTGGTDTTTVASRVAAIANSANDRTTSYTYNEDGTLASAVDGEGFTTTYGYNTRGQLVDEYRTISTGVTVDTRYERDYLGRATATIGDQGGLATRTEIQYDGFGRIAQTRDAKSEYTGYSYTDSGRTLTITDPSSRTHKTEYDAYGRMLKTWDGLNQLTTYAYDTANRKLTVTTPDGVSLSTWSTRTGEILKVQDRNGGVTEYDYTMDGKLATVKDARGVIVTQNTYDNSGRLYETRDGNGSVIRYTYDAVNRVVQRAVDPAGLNLRTSYAFDGQGRQITVTQGVSTASETSTQYVYDRKGQVKQIIVDPATLQLSTRFTYNGLGNILTMERGTVASPAQQLTQYTYDKLGRKTKEQLNPAGLNITTEYKYDANGKLTRIIHPNTHSAWYGYEDSGKLLLEIDALGGVTRYYYDNNGRLTETRRFFTAISTAGLGDNVDAVSDPSTHANDARTLYVYDSNNRLRYTLKKVDGSNWQASENLYDANGNIIETRRFDQYLANSDVTTMMADGVITEAEFTALSYAGNISSAGRAIQVYDANNRARYTVSAVDADNWMVTENIYDSAGNVIETRHYDKHISSTSVGTMLGSGSIGGTKVVEAEVAVELAALGYTGGAFGSTQRSFFAYDSANRLRFTVNALGEVSENVYDALGHVTAQTRFAAVPNLGGVYTFANIDVRLNRANPVNQTTQFVYDKAGRVTQTIDALGKNEYFGYDDMGNKTSYTDKRGASAGDATYTWTYTYDAVNRLTAEVTPAVSVIYSTNTTAQSKRLRTEFVYDAMGNVTSRTEGLVANTDGSVLDNTDARTTAYEYDDLGRQTKTTMPGWYDPATKKVEKNTGSGRFQLTSEVMYDTLGNAVRNKIKVASSSYIYQYKTYDGLGRVVHDIDALNYVTTNTYQGNNLVSIKRSANTLTASLPGSGFWTVADIGSNPSSSADDRIISFTYDRVGRKTQTDQQSTTNNYASSASATSNPTSITTYTAGATTSYHYNALGQLTAEKTKVDDTAWATTYHFYDQLNRESTKVDALGYVTASAYDHVGNLQQTIEYATAVTVTGTLTAPVLPSLTTAYNDRRTDYSYDKLNRLTAVQRTSVYINGSSFASALHEVQRNTYDNADNLTVQNTNGQVTATQYNALGQVTQVTEQQRTAASSTGVDHFRTSINAVPVTTYTFGVFGNAVKIERSASGAMNGAAITVEQKYDHIGNLLETTNGLTGTAAGKTAFEYDVAGHVTKEYQFATAAPTVKLTESRYFYDLVGRRIGTTRVVTNSTGTKHQSGDAVVYNAFGDIAQEKKIWGLETVTTFSGLTSSIQRTLSYDVMGRISSYQAQDGYTFYFYDLLGNVTREEKRGDQSTADGTDTRITETVYDLLGRATTRRLPAYTGIASVLGTTTSTLNPKLTQSFDRWGNVLSSVDAAGNTTGYVYNQNNQVIRETLPVTTVWREDGTSYTPALTHEIHYNGLGLAVLEVDKADGTELRSRKNDYDTVGHLAKATDATGLKTKYVYDALGNQVAMVNGLNRVFVYAYDALGNQTERGILRRWTGAAYSTNGTYAPVKVLLNTYEYDAVGRRKIDRGYSVTNSNGTTNTGTSYTKQYQYNELGNLLQSTNESGIDTWYKYDIFGNRIEDKNELLDTHKWTYDITSNYAFGRLTETKGVNNTNVTTYTYNDFGQLTKGDKGSLEELHEYHENGLLKEVVQTYTVGDLDLVDADYVYQEILTQYDYDIRGNIAREFHSTESGKETTNQGGVVYSASGLDFTQLMAFDARGRLEKVRLNTVGNGGQMGYMDLTYKYDEFGNRRKVESTYQRPGQTTNATKNIWYAYDKEGRVVIEDGITNTVMTIGNNQGIRFTYDDAGQRITEESYTTGSFSVSSPPEQVNYLSHWETAYTYTDLGLIKSQLKERTDTEIGSSSYYGGSYTYSTSSTVLNSYDLRGFKVKEDRGSDYTTYSYHADGRLINQIVRDSGDDLENRTNYTSYDAAGNLLEYQFKDYNSNGTVNYTNTYSYSYGVVAGEYKNDGISVSSTQTNYDTGETDIIFDAFGNVSRTYVNNGLNYTGNVQYTDSYLYYNTDGRIIYNNVNHTSETDTKNSYIYVNDNTVAKLTDVGASIFMPSIYDRRDGQQQAAIPSQYVVQDGDTLEGISQLVYGSSRYWYLIADANGLTYDSNEEIPYEDAGRALRIPNIVSNKYNDANTFKPYNPSEIIGDLTPSPVAPPPPSDKSNGFVAILAIVVTIAVAIYAPQLLGTLAEAMGGMVGATFGAAMGNLAGQAVNIAGGNQEKFDGDSFRTSIIGCAIGNALSAGSQATSVVKMGYAALGHAVAQKISVELGYQKEFSWASVATAAISAGVYEASGDKILTGFTSSMVGARLTAIETGQKTDWLGATMNAFGQMLGNAIVRELKINTATKLDADFKFTNDKEMDTFISDKRAEQRRKEIEHARSAAQSVSVDADDTSVNSSLTFNERALDKAFAGIEDQLGESLFDPEDGWLPSDREYDFTLDPSEIADSISRMPTYIGSESTAEYETDVFLKHLERFLDPVSKLEAFNLLDEVGVKTTQLFKEIEFQSFDNDLGASPMETTRPIAGRPSRTLVKTKPEAQNLDITTSTISENFTLEAGKSTTETVSEIRQVEKFSSWKTRLLGTIGFVADWGLVAASTFQAYRQEGGSTAGATFIWDSAETLISGGTSTFTGTVAGGAVTASGAGFSAPAGVVVGVATAAATDTAIDYWWEKSDSGKATRNYLIGKTATAIDWLLDLAD